MASKAFALVSFALAAVRVSGSAVWGQCGGIGWTGGTTCDAGSTCTYVNDWYSQCLPSTTTPPPTSPITQPTSPTSPTTAPSSTPTVGSSTCSTTSRTLPGYSDSALPDPFTFGNGSKVTTADDWACRRNELIAFIQAYEAGYLPPKPPQVSGSFSGNTLTVTAGGVSGGSSSSISFSSTITYPSGTAPANGWPLLIALAGGSIPTPPGVAVLDYNNDNIAQENDETSRGVGLFYNLYGSSANASAMTAWVWGVSRIIDVLEETPAAKIDVTKLAVTGCSRDGKGALMVGAFEPRIALTVAQESGSGGDACWRLSLYEQNSGSAVQTATEIVTENVWFSTAFDNYVNDLSVLPYDHHLLAALIAPRALLGLENTDFVWLSPLSSWGCMSAARTVFQALDIAENHGFIQQGGHQHCQFPSNQTAPLNAFFAKFLQGQDVDTDYFSTNDVFNGVQWVPSNWITWTTPTLS